MYIVDYLNKIKNVFWNQFLKSKYILYCVILLLCYVNLDRLIFILNLFSCLPYMHYIYCVSINYLSFQNFR